MDVTANISIQHELRTPAVTSAVVITSRLVDFRRTLFFDENDYKVSLIKFYWFCFWLS